MAAQKPAWKPGSKQERFAKDVFALNIAYRASRQLLTDITEQGLTPELRTKVRDFLRDNPV